MSCEGCGAATGPPRGMVRITFRPELPGQVCTTRDGLELEAGGWYVVATAEGERLGKLASYELPFLRPCANRGAGALLRRAGPRELERGRRQAEVEQEALAFCRSRARELNLPLRPVAAVVPLDRDVVHLTYAAEERVDLRELLRDLARHLRRRVELRQVGVRDQAKLSGGWGPCGRTLCCSSHMTRFASITIRMAKAQRLSLNPTRISGMCGRLMCCLAHEMQESPGVSRGGRP